MEQQSDIYSRELTGIWASCQELAMLEAASLYAVTPTAPAPTCH